MPKTIEAPSGVKLEVTALIDQDMWEELKAKGWTADDMGEAIKKSITFKSIVGDSLSQVPLHDIMKVELLKYY